jgi:hypothetical protein
LVEEEILSVLRGANAEDFQTPLPDHEVKGIAQWAARLKPGVGQVPEAYTDREHAQQVAAQHRYSLNKKEDSTNTEQATQRIAVRLADMHTLQEELTSSPHSHDELELALAAATSLDVSNQDDTALVWLLIVGVPSSDKTATMLLLKNSPQTYYLDTLTVNNFASGFVDARPGKGQQPDLLPLLNGKCLVIKDLTTLFSPRDDAVKKVLGDLQSIYDGEYAKATGTVGVIRHQSRFALLGCITPHALTKHHNYMASIGSRFLYYRIPQLTEDERNEGFMVTWGGGEERKKHQADLRRLAIEHIADVRTLPNIWTPETQEQQHFLQCLAKFVAHGRGAIAWQKSSFGDYEIASVQVEEPFRALQQLRNLARALARVHGRTALTDHELELGRVCKL